MFLEPPLKLKKKKKTGNYMIITLIIRLFCSIFILFIRFYITKNPAAFTVALKIPYLGEYYIQPMEREDSVFSALVLELSHPNTQF